MKKFKMLTSSAIVMTMVLSSVAPSFAYSKEETVYSKMKEDGTVKTVVVSEHLKNDQDEKSLEDETVLKEVKNVNGNETFTQDGTRIVWQSEDGQDIYYQGKTDKELPITLDVTYKLNGKEMSVDDMLGKAGDVEISIDYTNHETRVKNGKTYYIPFVVTTGTMLSGKTDSNVEVTNGKVIDNGSSQIVVAIAAPGLSKNFGNNSELEKFNHVKITYTTKEFKLNSIMSAASASLLSETDLSLSGFDGMFDGVNQLTSAYGQLIDGGKQLAEGAEIVNQNMKLLVAGTDQLDKGITQLDEGIQQIDTGVNSQAGLSNGVAQISNGTQYLLQSAEQLGQNINYDALQATLQKNGVAVDTVKSVDTATISEATSSAQSLAASKKELEEQVEKIDGYISKLEALKDSDDSGQIAKALHELNEHKKTLEKSISTMNNSINQLGKDAKVIETNAKTLGGVQQVEEGYLDTVESKYAEVIGGMKQIQAGIIGLQQGVQGLSQGTTQLKQGSTQVKDGSKTLKDSSKMLQEEGTQQLEDGTKALSEGLCQFKDQGLDKLTSTLNSVFKNNVGTVNTLMDLCKEYKTFAGSKNNVEATSKFVMIIDSKEK